MSKKPSTTKVSRKKKKKIAQKQVADTKQEDSAKDSLDQDSEKAVETTTENPPESSEARLEDSSANVHEAIEVSEPGKCQQLTILGKSFDLQILAALIILPLFVLAIYSNTYNVEFMYDDEKEIELDRKIRITSLSFQSLKSAFTRHTRPVAKFTFALNYYFDKFNTRYYHAVNTCIHIANGILLFFLIKITLNLPVVRNRRGPPGWIPLAVTLMWIVNPTQIQSVTYIVQRMNSLSAMFYLTTMLLYVNGRQLENFKIRWSLYFFGIITTALALGSKENAVTIPVFIFFYEWFFFQDLSVQWLKKRLPFIVGVLLIFVLGTIFFLNLDPIEVLQGRYKRTPFTMGQRVMTEWRVVMFYISQLFFPHPSQFNLLHAFSISTSFFAPITTLFSFITIVASLVFATIIAKKERLIAFCIFWFFGNLAIESTVIGLEIIYEHRSYLPSMFLFLLAITVVQMIIKNRIARKVIFAGVIGICCYWTYERNAMWADEIAYWHDTIEKNPQASRAYNDLANAYAMKGEKKKAVGIYYQGMKLNYNDWKMHFNLGVILDSLWETEKAIEQFEWVLRAKPNFAEAHHHLGMIYARKRNYAKAVWHTSEAIRLDPVGMQPAQKNLTMYKKWLATGGPGKR